MVNIKRIGSGILGAGAVLFVAAGAEAGLPTFDAANIAGTMSIVKNGSQNLKGIGDITNKVGELNTIVGDAAASVLEISGTIRRRDQQRHGNGAKGNGSQGGSRSGQSRS